MCKSVYVAKSESGLIKIGMSGNPERRMQSLRRATGEQHTLITSCVSRWAWADEQQLMLKFDGQRDHGEWFSLTDDQLSSLIGLVDGLTAISPCPGHAVAENPSVTTVPIRSAILTIPEAASRLNLSPENVRRLIREGLIRAAKIGAGQPGYRILASELERFARGETAGAAS